jgi:hypothetical protein
MPRVHINLQGIDEIEDLEQREDWEQLIGRESAGKGREARPASADGRGQRGFREQRFGGSEALDRKRSERRKHVFRAARRV